MKKIWQVLIAIDQLANTTVGGWADETLSARAYRNRDDKLWKWIHRGINLMFFWQHQHCKQAYDSETDRMQIAAEYRPKP